MLYRGRELDAISLWSRWVQFPAGMTTSGFAPLVLCPNPDHDATHRHFQVNLDEPLVHCFTNCGISGTYRKAIGMIEGIDERQAERIIRQHCAVGRKSSQPSAGSYRTNVRKRSVGKGDAKPGVLDISFERYIPAFGLEYLAGRGVNGDSVARWGLGWDANNRRIVIPAEDARGITRFLIKRAVREKDWPKYLYWPEKELSGWGKSDILFGACKLDSAQVRSEGLVLCEGSFDAISLHQAGARNTVAILGTKMSTQQVKIVQSLRPRRIICMFDKDGAGYRNIVSVFERLTMYPIFVCLYPKGVSDPAELSRKEVGRVIDTALSLVDFNQRLPKHLRIVRR